MSAHGHAFQDSKSAAETSKKGEQKLPPLAIGGLFTASEAAQTRPQRPSGRLAEGLARAIRPQVPYIVSLIMTRNHPGTVHG